jgi:membrane-associated phospholipid phosphatase
VARLLLAVLLAVCCLGSGLARAADGRCPMRTVASDGAALAAAPLHWGEWQWVKLAAGLGAVGITSLVDDELRDRWGDGDDAFAAVGDAYAFVGPVVALGYYSVRGIGGDPAASRTAWSLGESALFTFVATGLTKVVVGRERPDVDQDSHSFRPFSLDDDDHSLPSFHTGLAFSTAAVLQDADLPVVLKGAAYGLAGLTAWSRLRDDRHWFSDTVAGGLLGYTIGRWTVQRRAAADATAGYVIPDVGEGRVGLAWQRAF